MGEVPYSQNLLLDLCDKAVENRYGGVGESWVAKSGLWWLLRSCQGGAWSFLKNSNRDSLAFACVACRENSFQVLNLLVPCILLIKKLQEISRYALAML